MMIHFAHQDRNSDIVVWTDSIFAGCEFTGKPTSGGIVVFGMHCVKSWSKTQDVIALSSGEAEYYAMVKEVSQGLGINSMLGDLGATENWLSRQMRVQRKEFHLDVVLAK